MMGITNEEYQNHKFPFGKYRGDLISEFYNLSYLEFLYEKVKLDDKTRKVIGLRMYELQSPEVTKAIRKVGELRIPFGKYYGKMVNQVYDLGYLKWAVNGDIIRDPELKKSMKIRLKALEKDERYNKKQDKKI